MKRSYVVNIRTCGSESETVNTGDGLTLYSDIYVDTNARETLNVLYQLRNRNGATVFSEIGGRLIYIDKHETITIKADTILDVPGDYSLECTASISDFRFVTDYRKGASIIKVNDPNDSPFETSNEQVQSQDTSPTTSSPRPIINIHGDLTRTYLGGPPIIISLAIIHTIRLEQNLTANLIVRVPNGWSLTGSGYAQACTGVCNTVYELTPGENKPLLMEVIPNEVGRNQIHAKVEWVLDYKSDSEVQEATIGVEVYQNASDVPSN